MNPTITLTATFVHHKSADSDSQRYLYHMRHTRCYRGDFLSSGNEPLRLTALKGMCTHKQEKYSILEKSGLVCHVVFLQHFPPLPLKLLYPLFLLLCSLGVPLL